MCYYLYGGINQGVNEHDVKTLKNSELFHFRPCSQQELKSGIAACNSSFRLTSRMCDCDTAVGRHATKKHELRELASCIKSLREARNIKNIWIAKVWSGEQIETETNVHIDEIDLIWFLAQIEDNCLCKMQLFQKYY